MGCIYPLVMTNIAIENGPVEIVVPFRMGMFNSYVKLREGIMAIINNSKLVGGISTPLKNRSSSVGIMKFPTFGKHMKTCVKPPTNH